MRDDIVQCVVPERLGQNGVSVDLVSGDGASRRRSMDRHTHIHTSAKAAEEKEAG